MNGKLDVDGPGRAIMHVDSYTARILRPALLLHMRRCWRAHVQNTPGKDGFLTAKTGFAGMNVLRLGFEAPSLVFYKSDYSGVSCLKELVHALVRSVVSYIQKHTSSPGCYRFHPVFVPSTRVPGVRSPDSACSRIACLNTLPKRHYRMIFNWSLQVLPKILGNLRGMRKVLVWILLKLKVDRRMTMKVRSVRCYVCRNSSVCMRERYFHPLNFVSEMNVVCKRLVGLPPFCVSFRAHSSL